MRDKLKTALFRAAVLTFEELGFMFPNQDLYESQKKARAVKRVSVSFTGRFSGRLEMIVYGNVLPLIAANMLGVDETPSESQQDDALGEIINVICGNMLPNISSPEAVFDVGIPQFLEVTDSPSQKSDLFVTAELGIDRGRAGLFLFLERNTLP